MSSHQLPELGIGLGNHLYPSASEVVPVRAVSSPARVPAPVPTSVSTTAPASVTTTIPAAVSVALATTAQTPQPDPEFNVLKDRLRVTQSQLNLCQEQLRASQEKCLSLGTSLDAKNAECLNYERRLFVLEAELSRPQIVQAQPMFFPFPGGVGPAQNLPVRVVEVVEVVAPEPEETQLFEMEPDMSIVDAFTQALNAEDIVLKRVEVEEGEEKEDAAVEEEPVPPTPLPQKTVRRVDMSDLAAATPAASAARWTPEAVRTLAASLAGMTEKEVNKLSVETLTDNLAAFGKMYIKPKLAAAKLLHQVAKTAHQN